MNTFVIGLLLVAATASMPSARLTLRRAGRQSRASLMQQILRGASARVARTRWFIKGLVGISAACLVIGASVEAGSIPFRNGPGHPALAEKSELTKPWTKVEYSLRELVVARETGAVSRAPGAVNALGSLLREDKYGRVQVSVYLSSLTKAQLELLQVRGLEITFQGDSFGFVEGWTDVDNVEVLAALDFVTGVRPTLAPVMNTGSKLSDGDSILRAYHARSALGVSGLGVKVGLISDTVDGLSTAVASDELPSDVQVLKSVPGGTGEGTAMLEIVHDLAPGSPLAFYGPTTSGDMITGINQLKAAGATVIVDDLTFLDQPHFEEGPIAQAVNTVAAQGVVYATSAGNAAAAHYEAAYVDSNNGYGDHLFAPGVSSQQLTVVPGQSVIISLQWANKFGQSGDDYDLLVLDSSGSAVAGSLDVQNGDDLPLEIVQFYPTTPTVFVVVSRYSGVAQPIELYYYGAVNSVTYNTTAGSIPGHGNASGALTVATINVLGGDTIPYYSSQGPCNLAFPAAETRAKPDITGTDGVAVTGAAGFPTPFYGTSAAASHIAAIAALVRQANPALSAAQVRQALKSTSVDLGASGFDYVYGAGRANAYDAVASVLGSRNHSKLPTTLAGGATALEGFGATTPGGAGGRIIRVQTPTEAAVRAAITAANAGRAMIDFETTQPIPIQSALPRLTGNFVTVEGNGATLYVVAGKTANLIDVRGHDVIVRNIRLRGGLDNLRAQDATAYNVVFSHVSSTGSIDDGISIGYGAHDVTVQWCFLAGNTRSIFMKYSTTTKVSIHHSWIMKQWIRGPLVSESVLADLRNLIVEDWTEWGTRFEDSSRGNVVNSLFTLGAYAHSIGGKPGSSLRLNGRPVFTAGNVYQGDAQHTDDGSLKAPVPAPSVATQSVAQMSPLVRAQAGATPRDGVDQTCISTAAGWQVSELQPFVVPVSSAVAARAATSVAREPAESRARYSAFQRCSACDPDMRGGLSHRWHSEEWTASVSLSDIAGFGAP